MNVDFYWNPLSDLALFDDSFHVHQFKEHLQLTRGPYWWRIRYVSWPQSLQGFA